MSRLEPLSTRTQVCKDREQTIYWLQRAYEERSNILQYIEVHPHFDFIRNDPRFKDLEKRVGVR